MARSSRSCEPSHGKRHRSTSRSRDDGEERSKRHHHNNHHHRSRKDKDELRSENNVQVVDHHRMEEGEIVVDDGLVNDNKETEEEFNEEEYQRRVSEKMAELEKQEKDERDMPEVRRRLKQAILEKYENRQKTGTQLEKISEPSEKLSSVEVNVQAALSNPAEFRKSPSQKRVPGNDQRPIGTGGLGKGAPKSEKSYDMFDETVKEVVVAVEPDGPNCNWDDAEGYYVHRFGEVLCGRYEILAALGKGVFSTVVRARDRHPMAGDPQEVAIKIIRNNQMMYKAGMDEVVILNKLAGADPDNKCHCVRYLSNFKFRNHLCLVFESLNMNLRQVTKKFGRDIGLNLTAVRSFAEQLFKALKHLKNCGVLHCDIKPDNMLLTKENNVLKLCDLGSAMFCGANNEPAPYLVSRFYRAPEVILGLPYDHPLDMWSVGCCLFELYTGKILFPGATNNDMLRLHMEQKGPFPRKMLQKGRFTNNHFDRDLNFVATYVDPVTKEVIRRPHAYTQPNNFRSLISAGSSREKPKMVSNFKDLMEKIFVLNPEKRLTVSQALSHPFITAGK